MERYEGKKVVIIGGTSGMGLATAKMLLDGASDQSSYVAGIDLLVDCDLTAV